MEQNFNLGAVLLIMVSLMYNYGFILPVYIYIYIYIPIYLSHQLSLHRYESRKFIIIRVICSLNYGFDFIYFSTVKIFEYVEDRYDNRNRRKKLILKILENYIKRHFLVKNV